MCQQWLWFLGIRWRRAASTSAAAVGVCVRLLLGLTGKSEEDSLEFQYCISCLFILNLVSATVHHRVFGYAFLFRCLKMCPLGEVFFMFCASSEPTARDGKQILICSKAEIGHFIKHKVFFPQCLSLYSL